MWRCYDNKSTLGTKGSENGIIKNDEEIDGIARITLEELDDRYAITFVMYG